MPYMTDGHRDYQKEYQKYGSARKVVKKRINDNRARHMMMALGKVKVGDGKDVDHKRPQSKGGATTLPNLQAITASANRSFSRNQDGSLRSQTSRKERRK